MTVTATLAWWREPPDLLDRCIRSLAGFVDELVAVDGGYRLIPRATARSTDAEYDAIYQAAKAAGIHVHLVAPGEPWAGQVQKRDRMMKLAVRRTNGWLLVVDADYVLSDLTDRDAARRELGDIREHVIDVDLWTPQPRPDGHESHHELYAHEWHQTVAGKVLPVALLFRALRGFRVERHHWWYSGRFEGRRVALWGCDGLYPPVPHATLAAPFLLEHRCLTRTQELIDRNRDYCAERDAVVAATGVEP